MLLSNCCDAPIWGDETDPICSKCKEHCDFYDEETLEPLKLDANECGL